MIRPVTRSVNRSIICFAMPQNYTTLYYNTSLLPVSYILSLSAVKSDKICTIYLAKPRAGLPVGAYGWELAKSLQESIAEPAWDASIAKS